MPFVVIVDPGARGRLSVSYLLSDGDRFGHVGLPEVVSDADGWHFAPWR